MKMPDITLVPLETARFRIMPPPSFQFARQTLHWTQDRDAMLGLGWNKPNWNFRRWWRHIRVQGRKAKRLHGIYEKASGRPIGLHTLEFSRSGEVAVAIGVLVADRDWWGQGVVVEARGAIVSDCFTRLKVRKLCGQVEARNLPSVFNYQALGFRHEGTLRAHTRNRDGDTADMLQFGLLRDEWLAANS